MATAAATRAAEIMPLGDALALAERHRAAGRLGEAEEICRKILAAAPNEPNAEHVLGLIAHQSGRLGEAIEHVRRAVTLAPEVPLYHANLGEMCRLSGRIEDAVAEGRRAVNLNPDYPEALSNLGVALYEQKQYEEACACHRRAVALRPEFALGHSNLGNTLYGLKRFDEAIAAYRRAIALEPAYPDAWSNLGTALHHAGFYEEAIAGLRRAIALAPGHANAHSGLGILLLMRGDFAEGLEEYEWRLQSSEVTGPRFPQQPWQGESLAGRHIYVQAEQGFGDTIQFVRYLPLLKERAAAVSFCVHASLITLMQENLAGIEVLGDRSGALRADCDCALLSLPRLFKTRLETIPAPVPYLRPSVEVAARWRQGLAAMPGLKVGVVWAGRPEHANNHRRSLPLSVLAPLFQVPGVSFASLQVGPAAADLPAHPTFQIVDLSPQLIDFGETAGALAALDLLIAVDTSAAHLAGALGRPVWVLLPTVTDWRWLLGREDNRWYPTMRLFRQQPHEPWADVIGRVGAELAAVSRGDTLRLTPFRDEGERRATMAAQIMAIESSVATSPPPVQSLAPQQALMHAERHRRAGRLGEAEDLCRKVIAAQPNSAEAEHLLGLIAHQSGKLAEAMDHVRRAIAIDGNVALYHANLGEMCRLSGRPDLAADEARRALEVQPDYPGALSNLGIALYELKDYQHALDCYDRAIALMPDFADAHSNRGNVLRALERLAEAETAYRRALEVKPGFAQAWNNLGTTLRDLKRPEQAAEAYRKALAESPDDPNTLDNLALALTDLEQLDEAVGLLRRALALDPRGPKLGVHLASVLIDQRKGEAATPLIEHVLTLEPANFDAINLRGRVAFERGALVEALAYYRRALEINPDCADTYNNMGNALRDLGRLDEARDAFHKALELDPRNVGIYVNLSDTKQFSEGDADLAAMRLLDRDGNLAPTERLQLDFALGKAYGDLKDHARAFEYWRRGNQRKRARIAYDEAATADAFERIKAVFTPALIEGKSGRGDTSPVPVFILGMPRSGTTLVEQILASHPLIHGAGELRTFSEIVNALPEADPAPIPYPEVVRGLDPAAIKQIGARYVATLARLAPGAAYVTDKMPSNYFFVGLIHLALPNARIIHTVRDPIDTCVSCFSKLFTAEQNHTYDLAELGRYYCHYQALMAHWHCVLPQGRILDVRYEDVVGDLEGQARRILAHCGLEWHPNCLAFHRTERPVRTASATQVRQPIYTSAVGRWRVYQDSLAPLIAELDRPVAEAGAGAAARAQ